MLRLILYKGTRIADYAAQWNGTEFEFRRRQEVFLFSKMSTPDLGSAQPTVQRVTGLFRRGKVAGA
jgi:hypothetical protein